MTLRELMEVSGGTAALPEGLLSANITGLAYDSRQVEPGDAFFAIAGAQDDGKRYATQAIERGALAVASDAPAPETFAGPWIRVPHTRRALGLVSARFYAGAVAGLRFAGTTGTNGKTTTVTLLRYILQAAGFSTVTIGTIEYLIAGRSLPAKNTTPESLELFRFFAEGRAAGAAYALMEVSSHALAQERVAGLEFDAAVWTNLTRDHLDYHHDSMDEYFAAKQRLFEPVVGRPPRAAVLNADDSWARKLKIPAETETVWYSTREAADLRASRVESSPQGLRFQIDWRGSRHQVTSRLAGQMNVQNILGAFGAAATLGIEPETIVRGVADCQSVPGRFERVDAGQPFTVIVDYAHTDDALRNALQAVRALGAKRVITVFGCGGDRDRAKRPLMGQAAGDLSGFVVLTSDNPRSEDPLAIINDALVGLRRTDTPHVIEPDREKAIRRALSEAGPDDAILIAGKGHETYQVLKDRTIDFDDRAVARRILEEFGYRGERA